ncbi:MAG TPA: hypothetical protein VD994_08220 [Prosthecobacter sp.]|nr:hypothetical protein [Prosthecobacter sp.]
MVESMLKAGKLLVLLDALDEVAQDRVDAVVEQALSLVRRYPDCRFIVSCRVAFPHHFFTNFQDATLLDFTNEQIDCFIRNWFSSPEQKADKIAEGFIKKLHSPGHEPTLELARSPVLLSYMCVAYQGTLALSTNRAEIYRKALDIYLQEWNANEQKTKHAEQVHATLPHHTELALLAQVAYQAFTAERFFLTKDEWLKEIHSFMSDLVDKPRTLATEDILQKIAVSQGLVVQRTHQDWSFSHLTLQEYLTAYHIDQTGLMEDTVKNHLHEDRWREVFLILAGIKPTQLLTLMVCTAKEKLIQHEPGWASWRTHFSAWKPNQDLPEEEIEALVASKVTGVFIYLALFFDSLKPSSDLALPSARAIFRRLALTNSIASSLDRALFRALSRARTRICLRDLSRDLSATARSYASALEKANYPATLAWSTSRESIRFFSSVAEESSRIHQSLKVKGTSDAQAYSKLLNEANLEPLNDPHAINDYLRILNFLFACKDSAALVPLRKGWCQVLNQMF